MSCPPCNRPSARIADVLDLALDRARDLKQVVINKLTKLTPRHWVWFVVGALLLGSFVEIVERYFPQLAPKINPLNNPEPAKEDDQNVPVQFGPTRLPTFGEDDWFIYTEIRIEAWLMHTLQGGRAPLVGQDDLVERHGDDQRRDICEELDKFDNDSINVEREVEVDPSAGTVVVAPSEAVTVSPVVSELDVPPSISSDVIKAYKVQSAFASSESVVKETRNDKDKINIKRYPVRDRELNRIVATVPRKRVSVDLDLDSDDEAREASEERHAKQVQRRRYLDSVVQAWRKGVPIEVGELDAPAPSPIPRPAAPTPRAAARIETPTEKRRLQGLSIHLMPDTLEGWTALVGSGLERTSPGLVLSRSRRPSAALVASGSGRQSVSTRPPPSVDVDVEKAVAKAMFEFKTLEPIIMVSGAHGTFPLMVHRRHVSAPTTPLTGRHEDRRVSFKSLLDWSPQKRVDEDEDVLIPALTAAGSSSPTGTDLSTPSTHVGGVEATAMIEVSRKLAEFRKSPLI